jgi:hypothetical protein
MIANAAGCLYERRRSKLPETGYEPRPGRLTLPAGRAVMSDISRRRRLERLGRYRPAQSLMAHQVALEWTMDNMRVDVSPQNRSRFG